MNLSPGVPDPIPPDGQDPSSTAIFLVRHGQTDLNRDRAFRGLAEVSLNDTGRAQAKAAGGLLSGEGITELRTSPTRRALETAELAGEKLNLEPVIDERFNDVDYGSWQGLTVEEVEKKFGPGPLESWRKHPGEFVFPGGDSMGAVRERIERAVFDLASERPGGKVALVSHLAVLKTCLVAAMDLPFEYFWRLELDNGSVSALIFDDSLSFTLGSWNRTAGP